ncbi:molybdopterin molybdotransferase MoeA [Nesterenkonia aerolata]|uniref:Molybdopterin molybdenumtransferase n=1 Tax=Nesterenkonia aerolata TaxID=3074079 RepID=A0ABU2DSH2_9MICC|nr:molybdopterin molybdotransferase MoeA [Nesterenkonia sp. LY-0111]MDR8019458.1 molybdopterin molybdotransferase MoeA [Nesterenkonia sp. LY-0111]
MTETPSWQEAMMIAASLGAPVPAHPVPLAEAIGATAAEELRTRIPLPHYDSAAMDGYAVSGPGPWRLDPVGSAEPTGGLDSEPHRTSGTRPLPQGCARAVLTGGLIPEGTSSVLRQEFADDRGGWLHLAGDRTDDPPAAARGDLTPGRHIRTAGCEAPAGTVMVTEGTVLSPAHIAYLSIAGFDEVLVRSRPRVTVLTTGDEVISRGMPQPGQVRDAFTPVLPTVLGSLGARPVQVHRVGDDRGELDRALDAAVDASDLVVTTGGTGRSGADLVRRALTDRGTVAFSEVAMRPGHPTMAARLPSAERAVPVVALPGNPLAAMVALRVVVQPVIEAMLDRAPRPVSRVPTEPVQPSRVDRLLPGLLAEDGLWRTTEATGANMLRGLAAAQGLLVLPREGISDGGEAVLLDLPW